MKFEIIGSGGCVSLPKPLCQCKVCREAREKGRPYARCGCSLFLHDMNMLVDTPEDIVSAINQSSIEVINYVLYSHADPDHALGFRVFEQLKLNWFDVAEGKTCQDPIQVLALQNVLDDLYQIKSKYGPYMDYYENERHLIETKAIDKPIQIGDIQLSILPCGDASIFIFESHGKSLVYAPCDVKPFTHDEALYDADILLLGNTIIGDVLKDGRQLPPDSFMRQDLFCLKEVADLKREYRFKRVIMTHLEEDWGKSYDDYKTLEKDGVLEFAYDGMILEL